MEALPANGGARQQAKGLISLFAQYVAAAVTTDCAFSAPITQAVASQKQCLSFPRPCSVPKRNVWRSGIGRQDGGEQLCDRSLVEVVRREIGEMKVSVLIAIAAGPIGAQLGAQLHMLAG